jgi:hypothetical protein
MGVILRRLRLLLLPISFVPSAVVVRPSVLSSSTPLIVERTPPPTLLLLLLSSTTTRGRLTKEGETEEVFVTVTETEGETVVVCKKKEINHHDARGH